MADLVQIPLNANTLVQPPGGWIDLSSVGAGVTRRILVQDNSNLDYAVDIIPMVRLAANSGRFVADNSRVTLFPGPAPVLLTTITGSAQYFGQRMYLIFIGYTRSRPLTVTLVA